MIYLTIKARMTWVALGTYFFSTVLFPSGLVYCASSDGHGAIELSHVVCPEHVGGVDSQGQTISNLGQRGCVDSPLPIITPAPCQFRSMLQCKLRPVSNRAAFSTVWRPIEISLAFRQSCARFAAARSQLADFLHSVVLLI